jgi:hypothetical protein
MSLVVNEIFVLKKHALYERSKTQDIAFLIYTQTNLKSSNQNRDNVPLGF